ncbi:DExH-box ATP-dependent RNA helicase DExH15 chloroplastic-like [Hibiscus syriacus]|uniref:DExH-box ATP-dependent RNA helicase DExH15 chloroplastic-like n=1 Tax=Hibiscus syriacus TaxID=106335 RepID=UPI001923D38E|nr:DExH-box ATP-dependent RNA helicase DExH15 chloroplastic-like [Hibiscus syriacus]
MPSRTAVISSLSKRTSTGRIQLSPNELLQMAGRAGRRGIDERGHVVIVQTPYEGAEECCKLLFSGVEPLVSQFTASYGMVLNLLGGAKVTRRSNELDETNTLQARRTLEEARKLVEQSFGNYLGSNVMLAAKEELAKIQKEIETRRSKVPVSSTQRRLKLPETCRRSLSTPPLPGASTTTLPPSSKIPTAATTSPHINAQRVNHHKFGDSPKIHLWTGSKRIPVMAIKPSLQEKRGPRQQTENNKKKGGGQPQPKTREMQ